MTRRGIIFIVALALIASTTLTGCASAVGERTTSSEALEKATLHFVGLPGLMGIVGTSTPVNGSYSLTAAHVAKVMPQMDVVAYHPKCDIALIKTQNQHGAPVARLRLGTPVDVFGYSGRAALPQTGHGKVTKTIRLDGCIVNATTAGAVQGMSGGPAFQGGNLVGIITAINTRTDESIVVPVQSITSWLKQWGIYVKD